MTGIIRRRITGWIAAALAVAGTVGIAQAQTNFYWAGGTSNKNSGVDAMYPTNGNWDVTTANWSDQTNGALINYSAWNNAAPNIANFGTRVAPYLVTLTNNAQANLGGLNTYVFDGTNGTVTLRATAAGAQLVINNGAVLNIATGTVLALSSSSGSVPLGMVFTNFTITGGGTLNTTFYGGAFVSGVGTVTVTNARFASGSNGGANWPFGNSALNLSDPYAIFDLERPDEWVASVWRAITGVGKIQALTAGAGAGMRAMGVNSLADSTLSATLLDGPNAGVLMVLYKTGAGTLTVMSTNNAYFGNYVHQGVLTPGAMNAISGWVLVDGSTAVPSSAGIFGMSSSNLFHIGWVTAESGGQINGANLSLSQYQLMAGGAVLYNAASEIPGTGRVLNGAQPGAVIAGGYAFDDTFLQRIQESFDGVIALGTNIGSGVTLHFDGAGGNFSKARLGAWGLPRTFDGTLVANGGNYRLGGGNSTLTLTAPLTGTGSLDVSDGPNKGYFGQGTFPMGGIVTNYVFLTANNTVSGPVAVGNGTVLVLSNATGRLSGATGITVTSGGTLVLADGTTTNNSNSDRIPAVEVALQRSGNLRFTGQGTNASAAESVGQLTINGGYSTITSARGTGNGNARLQFSNLAPTNWGMASFSVGGSSQIGFVTPPVANQALLGPWAVFGSSGFAAYQTTNGGTIGAAVTVNVGSDANWQLCTPNTNAVITASFTASQPVTVGSVVFNASTPTVVCAGLNTVTAGGLMGVSSATPVLTNGQWTAATPDHGLYIYNFDPYSRLFTIYSDIVDNGGIPVTLVAAGAGTMVLSSSNNTFSGDVVINGSTLRATTPTALGTGSNIVLNGVGATVEFFGGDTRTNSQTIIVNADARVLTLNGTVPGTPAGSTILNGNITLNNNSLLTLGQFGLQEPATMNGVISGSGSLRLRKCIYNSNYLTIQGAAGNTYTGDTFIAAPVMLNKSSGNAIPGGNVYFGTVETGSGYPQRPMLVLAQNNQIGDSAVLNFAGGLGGTNTAATSPVLRFNGKSDESRRPEQPGRQRSRRERLQYDCVDTRPQRLRQLLVRRPDLERFWRHPGTDQGWDRHADAGGRQHLHGWDHDQRRPTGGS